MPWAGFSAIAGALNDCCLGARFAQITFAKEYQVVLEAALK